MFYRQAQPFKDEGELLVHRLDGGVHVIADVAFVPLFSGPGKEVLGVCALDLACSDIVLELASNIINRIDCLLLIQAGFTLLELTHDRATLLTQALVSTDQRLAVSNKVTRGIQALTLNIRLDVSQRNLGSKHLPSFVLVVGSNQSLTPVG